MKKKLSLVVGATIFSISTASWAIPVWSIVPNTPTTMTVPANIVSSVNYTITNNSVTHTLMMVPMKGISQTTTGAGICSNPFTLSQGASCILSLQINGSELTTNINSGPKLCQQRVDGQPDLQECYQPASHAASLNITAGSALVVGDSFGGGTVACTGGAPYLNLIAATNDNSTGIKWNNGSYVQTGAYSDNDGSSNTTQIVTTQGPTITNYAAGLCQSYNGGGYHDWFLPAKNQLNCLYQNITAIGNFSAAGYWSLPRIPRVYMMGHGSSNSTPLDIRE
jgi:hypothetical protein